MAEAWFEALQQRRVDDAWDVLIREALDANVRDPRGATAMHYAAAFGDASLLEKLLGIGADTTICTLTNETPLMQARRLGHVDVMRRLFQCDEIFRALERQLGRPPSLPERTAALTEENMRDFRDKVVDASSKASHTFVEAARNGDLRQVREMLKNGQVHQDAVHPTTGETALGAAVVEHRRRVYDYLLDAGACPDGLCLRKDSHVSPLTVAVMDKDASLVRTLAWHGARLDDPMGSRRELCALSVAALHSSLDVIDTLLDLGASVSRGLVPTTHWYRWECQVERDDRSSWIVLALACQQGNAELVQHMLTTRRELVNPNRESWAAVMVLCLATQYCSLPILILFLDHGFDQLLAVPGWATSRRSWPLKYTLLCDDLPKLRLLLDHTPPAVLDYAATSQVPSLLECAAQSQASECVAFLLSTAYWTPNHFDNALEASVQTRNLALVDLLLSTALPSSVGVFYRCIQRALMDRRPRIVKLLLSQCEELPWVTGPELDMFLVYACTHCTSVPTLNVLLAHGASVHTQSTNGKSLLSLAAKHKDGAALVLWLLEHGADAMADQGSDDAPLSVLLKRQQQRNDDECALAIKRLVALGGGPSFSHVS